MRQPYTMFDPPGTIRGLKALRYFWSRLLNSFYPYYAFLCWKIFHSPRYLFVFHLTFTTLSMPHPFDPQFWGQRDLRDSRKSKVVRLFVSCRRRVVRRITSQLWGRTDFGEGQPMRTRWLFSDLSSDSSYVVWGWKSRQSHAKRLDNERV